MKTLFSCLFFFLQSCYAIGDASFQVTKQDLEEMVFEQLSPLIKQIILVESGWNSDAVSSKMAVGLMQIKKQGALASYNKHHQNKFDINQMREPLLNIIVGKWYLNFLIKAYGGDIIQALSAYHMGPTKVRQGFISKRYCEKIIGTKKVAKYFDNYEVISTIKGGQYAKIKPHKKERNK